jgi:hypothetical protein
MSVLFILQLLTAPSLTASSEPLTPQIENQAPQEKKYLLSICSVFKNEDKILKEWIEYHKLVGVDHFYLYNNSSTDNSLAILQPYIEQNLVTLVDWPDQNDPNSPENAPYRWVALTQLPAFVHACKELTSKETTWLALIDVDEFLLPIKSYTFSELLGQYKEYGALVLFWQTYGTSDLPTIPPHQLHVELLHKTCYPEHTFNKDIVKSIVKPEYFDSWRWPGHMIYLKDGLPHAFIPREEARINHYISRSIDYIKNVKVKNKQHQDNRIYPEAEINELLSLGNDVEDNEKVIHRYVPELKKRLNLQ